LNPRRNTIRAMALARETDGVSDVIDNMKMLQPVG
jgi:hypothetical protein